jgi:hypothetical protein
MGMESNAKTALSPSDGLCTPHATTSVIFRKLHNFKINITPTHRPGKMRLTTELINNSLSYINPLHELELDLRGT